MRKTFIFKFYHASRNRHLHRRIDIAAGIYNHCIALHKRYYRITGKYLNKYRLQKHLVHLKRMERHAHWNLVGSQAVQDITDRIERTYRRFFDSLKSPNGMKVRPPTFKKKGKYRSFTLKQAGYALLEGNRIRIHDKVYKYHRSRDIKGRLKTLTVKRDTLGDIYLCFSCEIGEKQTERAMTGKIAGFDFGLHTFLTSSDGMEKESPLFFRHGLKELKLANRTLSRKKKGSKNRKRAVLHLARVHKRIADRRKDHHFKLAMEPVNTYDELFFEDLNLKGMQKLWGRKVSDLGFRQFLGILDHVAMREGALVGSIDRFYPSSKECSYCGYIHHELSLKDREWDCPNCGAHHHRDKNAANNIVRVGTSTQGRGGVRPCLTAASA